MTDATRTVPFVELADRLGVGGSTASPGRHRTTRDASPVGRVVAGTIAGAALSGGVAMAAAPAASAQSVAGAQIDPAQFLDTARLGAMAQEAARQFGITDQQMRQYAGIPGLDFLGNIPGSVNGSAHAPTVGTVTSGFGPRWGANHNGLDIAAPLGTPMHAAKSGTVVAAGPASGYGLWIRILTDDGYLLEYGHQNANYVSEGQRVNAGQVIGEVGNRGNSTGPHLHFGVRNPAGQWIDPQMWLASNGVIM